MSAPALRATVERHGRDITLRVCREAVGDLRRRLLSGTPPPEDPLGEIADEVSRLVAQSLEPSVRSVINATGVLLHTNLGRAPLSRELVDRAVRRAAGYSNLEMDLSDGRRGSRTVHFQKAVSALFPGTAALVVNNNAAAVLLVLNTIAEGREVVVSRGELVEIGGSFRIPDICIRSNARLVEVGTTNRTRLADFARAIRKETAMLMKVHTSNFRVVGFTEGVDPAALAALGRKKRIPVVADLGSGSLVPLPEPLAEAAGPAFYLKLGYNLICFSGDKLMGSCQAGIILGQPRLVDALRRNPLYRALRPDKLTIALLEETLMLARSGRLRDITSLRMALTDSHEIELRCRSLAERLTNITDVDVRSSESLMGGGSSTDLRIPTFLVRIQPRGMSDSDFLAALRRQQPPVVARVERKRVILDLRSVPPEQDEALFESLRTALA